MVYWICTFMGRFYRNWTSKKCEEGAWEHGAHWTLDHHTIIGYHLLPHIQLHV